MRIIPPDGSADKRISYMSEAQRFLRRTSMTDKDREGEMIHEEA